MFRQGDVLITPVSAKELPKAIYPVEREDGRLILAHGEATGHAHAIEGDATLLTGKNRDESRPRFLKVRSRSRVVHEEHGTIELKRGTYRIDRQREHTPRPRGSSRRRSRLVYD